MMIVGKMEKICIDDADFKIQNKTKNVGTPISKIILV